MVKILIIWMKIFGRREESFRMDEGFFVCLLLLNFFACLIIRLTIVIADF